MQAMGIERRTEPMTHILKFRIFIASSPFYSYSAIFDLLNLRTIILHSSIFEKDGSGREFYILRIVRDHDDGLPFFMEGLKKLHDFFSCFRIEISRGLVSK